MKPGWRKLAGLAREVCALWFRSFGAVFASKGYPIKNIFDHMPFIPSATSFADNSLHVG